MSDLNITPDGTRILAAPGRYAAELGQATAIKVYDATTLSEVDTIDFTTLGSGSYVSRLAVGDTRAYALVSPANSYDKARQISVFDTTTNTEIATIAAPNGVWDVAVSPDGDKVYVTQTDGRTVIVIDAETNTVQGKFTTDESTFGAQDVAAGLDGVVYVTDNSLRTVYAVKVGDSTPPNNVAPAWQPLSGTFNEATGVTTGKVKVADGDNDTVKYYLLSPASMGTVTIDENTGNYVYTPLLSNDGYNLPSEDSFAVIVTRRALRHDGQRGRQELCRPVVVQLVSLALAGAAIARS